jgi:hypothetical protein
MMVKFPANGGDCIDLRPQRLRRSVLSVVVRFIWRAIVFSKNPSQVLIDRSLSIR